MKIAVAQLHFIRYDILANIIQHKKIIDLALAHNAAAIFFPELSLTGYEPELAADLATTQADPRLDDFQQMSDAHQLVIGAGLPIQTDAGICIGMVIFQSGQPRQTYLKKYLHHTEAAFFSGGQDSTGILGNDPRMGLAICYELSVPEHAEHAFRQGATVYIASAVEPVTVIDATHQRLSYIARNYGMTVLLSNCIGQSGGYNCAGRSAAWNDKGELLDQLDDCQEGILMLDTVTQEVVKATLSL